MHRIAQAAVSTRWRVAVSYEYVYFFNAIRAVLIITVEDWYREVWFLMRRLIGLIVR